MYKEDLAFNNLQDWYAIKPNQTKSNMYKEDLALNNLQGLICHETQANNLCNLGVKASYKRGKSKDQYRPNLLKIYQMHYTPLCDKMPECS